MDVYQLNRQAWDIQSSSGESPWAQPVDAETIQAARDGSWQVILTPTLPVPREWFGELDGATVLGLASGGGQQVPTLAAAGAKVISLDASPEQLAKDQSTAKAFDLDVSTVLGDMADLSQFEAESFDLIFHPVSNLFCSDIQPVWHHCARILKPGGRLLSGFMNPDFYLFDHEAIEQGESLEVKFELPFRDTDHLSELDIRARINQGWALEFSHSLDAQIGGQLAAGLVVHGFYEDRWDNEATPLNQYMPTSMATLAIKPGT